MTGEKLTWSQEELDALTTEELFQTYKRTGSEELKWPLVMRYMGLVKTIALQVRGVYSSFAQVDDIVNEGLLTLAGAVDKFDPDKGIIELDDLCVQAHPGRGHRSGPAAGLGAPQRAAQGPGHRPGQQ